ncbi:MAG: ABC transporter substrate-binding protein [Desulfovibrio sp.]|jgi:phospholipid transport system substrate-binding protein|nr:ABC transporter substrate-binding protein [Desulfovibrio sp.]
MSFKAKYIVQSLGLCLILLACVPCAPAKADSEAKIALENCIGKVLNEIKKPEMKNPATRERVLADIEKIIKELFNFPELSMRAVGPKWRSFTPEQQKNFLDAFDDLLRSRYLDRLEGYSGERVAYTGETTNARGDRMEIRTEVTVGDKIVPVAYRMLKNGRWTVYDIVIEGVSMVQNYRSQFQAVLDKGDAEELIRLVRKKAEEARLQKGKS